jgi:serine/threonine-protein kinase RsbW
MTRSKKPSTVSEGRERVEECVVTSEHLDAVHEAMARLWHGLANAPPERWRLFFEIAVAEVAANIVEHAIASSMTLRLRAGNGQVVAEFLDGGRGWEGAPTAARLLDTLAERGRGLAMASAALDEMTYERRAGVNRWRLVKRL